MTVKVRTIRDGAVRIDGVIYRPDLGHAVYDGRLDGMRYEFSTYRNTGPPLAALLGRPGTDEAGPECINGSFPWYFWSARQ